MKGMSSKKTAGFLTKEEIIEILLKGKVDLKGQFVLGSNYTFMVQLEHQAGVIEAVYKPLKGEMPLWDFPPETLAARETAAYLVSEALGWQLVPPTVMRPEGPFGKGSLQLFIPHDPDLNYFSFSADLRQMLRPVALFDLITNNADRKGSHIIVDESRHFRLIDQGLCFHAQPKLRTVIWDFSGEKIPASLIDDLKNFLDGLNSTSTWAQQISNLLYQEEFAALKSRIQQVINHPEFPSPDLNTRPFPWPLV
jgi:uncharacterized repeat protein (TIGR03843 family)